MAKRAEIPENIEWPKSSSKVGLGGILEKGQKVGLEVGFPLERKRKTYIRTYFLTYFENSPETSF